MVFRYPGGKTKLLKKFQHLLVLKDTDTYYEPFVGGGSVTVHIAKKYPNTKIVINDLDEYVYSFWKLFELNLDSYFEELFKLINQTPTVDLFSSLRDKEASGLVEKAYYAIFFNRTTFSGIFKSGPIGGYEQKSKWKIGCRYNATSIITKINLMRDLFKDRIEVRNLSFEYFFDLIPKDNSFIYLDPPYFKKGKILYNKYMANDSHTELSQLLRQYGNWILSYDNCEEIIHLYENFTDIVFIDAKYSIKGKKDICNDMKECIIIPRTEERGER